MNLTVKPFSVLGEILYFLTLQHGNVIRYFLLEIFQASYMYIAHFHTVHPLMPPANSSLPTRALLAIILLAFP